MDKPNIASKRRLAALANQASLPPLDECDRYPFHLSSEEILLLRSPKQLAIRDIMGVTAIIAIWFAMFVASSDTGWLFLGTALWSCAALILRKPFLVFLLPLVLSTNLILLVNFFVGWAAPSVAILIGYAFAFIIAVSESTIRCTCLNFKEKTIRTGVVFFSIKKGTLSGILVAFQFGLPVFISCVATWFTKFPVPLGRLVYMAVVFPLVTCSIVGAVLGGVLGIVCDRLIALNVKNGKTPVSTIEH